MALWIWIYCVIVFLIQDAVKVGAWWVIRRYNFLNVNNVVKIQKQKDEEPFPQESIN